MNIRNYNIFFHTHTISGIIICAILYVIFFAGSFSFFKHEISAWQKGVSYSAYTVDKQSYDRLIDSLREEMNLQGRDLSFYIQRPGNAAYVDISMSNDTVLHKENMAKLELQNTDTPKTTRGRRGRNGDAKNFNYDFKTKTSGDYASNYDMGEFLYRLHFLAQLNQVPIRIGIAPFGYFIAGLTSFLFLFALITGLLLHWDKIVSNFFVFRPFSKWKTVWTDMHTALGVIGFPYQFIYAVTGIVLIINSVLIIPFSQLLYDGNRDQVYQDLGYSTPPQQTYLYAPIPKDIHIADYISLAQQKWPDAKLAQLYIKNYQDSSMRVIMNLEPRYSQHFAGSGVLDIRVHDQHILSEKSPSTDLTYLDQIRSILYRLHFGDYGGYPGKAVYFVLGIMGCLVIISGILIWLVARNKNNIPAYKRKFNLWLSNVFLAICLTMLPVTAITFIAIKISPEVNQQFIYKVYFYSWLLLAVYYTLRKNISRTNRETLLLSTLLAVSVPIANGIITRDWIWKTFMHRQTDIFIIDFLWLMIGIICMIAYVKTRHFLKAAST